MTAVVIVAVVLFSGTAALLVWGPWLTSLGIATEPTEGSSHDAHSAG